MSNSEQVHMEMLDQTLHFLGKHQIQTNVLQIGANDGYLCDDIRGYINMYEWGGLFIEPIPEYFEKLKENCKNNKNHIFENCAISNYDGLMEMLYVSVKDIEQNDLHFGYKGMACVLPARNGFGSEYVRDKEVRSKYGKLINIPVLTLQSVLQKHNVKKIDLLISDTEGHESVIFNQIDFSRFRPKAIHIEWINSTEEEAKEMIHKFKNNNYVYEFIGENLNAIDKNLWDIVYCTLSEEQKKVEIKSALPSFKK